MTARKSHTLTGSHTDTFNNRDGHRLTDRDREVDTSSHDYR